MIVVVVVVVLELVVMKEHNVLGVQMIKFTDRYHVKNSYILKYFRNCSIPFKTPNASGVAVSSKYQYNFELNALA